LRDHAVPPDLARGEARGLALAQGHLVGLLTGPAVHLIWRAVTQG